VEKSSLTKQRAKLKLMSEIKIHKSMNHKGIVLLQKYFEDKDNVYIVLELCPNLSLNDMLKRRKRFTEIEAKYYVKQLVSSVQYL
jgi:polo-like kinase 1